MNPKRLCGQPNIYFFYNTSEKVTSSMSLKFKFFIALFYKQGTIVLPGGSGVKNLSAHVGDTEDEGSVFGLGRSPGGGNGNPL